VVDEELAILLGAIDDNVNGFISYVQEYMTSHVRKALSACRYTVMHNEKQLTAILCFLKSCIHGPRLTGTFPSDLALSAGRRADGHG
jgi:hypothetical protein